MEVAWYSCPLCSYRSHVMRPCQLPLGSLVRPVCSFLHILAMSGHASRAGAVLGPAFTHKSLAHIVTQVNLSNAEVHTAWKLMLDSIKEVTREHMSIGKHHQYIQWLIKAILERGLEDIRAKSPFPPRDQSELPTINVPDPWKSPAPPDPRTPCKTYSTLSHHTISSNTDYIPLRISLHATP